MKALTGFVVAVATILGAVWFVKVLQYGNDLAWLALGVLGTLTIYLIFSVVELVKDRWHARWLEGKLETGNMRRQFAELYEVSRVQGQLLANQKKIGQLVPGNDDLFTYEDALAGDVIELPVENDNGGE